MPLIVKHNFVSGLPDGADITQIQPSHWNDGHTLSGSLAIAQIDGLQVALDDKVGSASLVTALAPYLTSSSAALSTYVTSASLVTALTPYLTSASAALSTYVTSSSLATALAPYLTSASAALSTYVTSSSLATALGPYLTSASAALATYLTSLSASTALATKQPDIQFQDESVNLGAAGDATTVNITGTGVSASLTGGVLTLTIPAPVGGGEGSVSISTMISVAPVLAPETLTVGGTATFSGTAVFTTTAQFGGTVTFSATAAFKVRPVITTDGGVLQPFGAVLLGEISLGAARQSVRFSGSWTNIARFNLELVCKVTAASATASIAIYSDGGTTPFLNGGSLTLSVSHGAISVDILDSGAFKSIRGTKHTVVVAPAGFHTATANTAVINCIQVAAGASVTLSAGIAQLYGWYR